MENQPDRVNVSFGMKVPGPSEYSSINFNVSLSSDVKDGETLEEAWQRVKSEVDERSSEFYEQYGQLQSQEESDEEEDIDEEDYEEEDD